MISKKELLRRIEILEQFRSHVHTSKEITHFSTEPEAFKDPYGNLGSYYPMVGNIGEILGAIIKFCGIELKTIPPTEKRIEVVKKEKK